MKIRPKSKPPARRALIADHLNFFEDFIKNYDFTGTKLVG
jgi:hypothetical protein